MNYQYDCEISYLFLMASEKHVERIEGGEEEECMEDEWEDTDDDVREIGTAI